MPTINEIVKEYLKQNGYDGLLHKDEWCACLIDDLMPCGEPNPGCVSGYKGACTGGDCDGDCDYHIYADKADALAADEEHVAAVKAG